MDEQNAGNTPGGGLQDGSTHTSSAGGSKKAIWTIVALIILAGLIWLGLTLKPQQADAPEPDDTTSEISEDLNELNTEGSVDLDAEFQELDNDIEQL